MFAILKEGRLKHRCFLILGIFLLAAMILPAILPQVKADALMVYGDRFIFGVQEPENWTGDTENAARLHVNVLFYPKGQAWNSQGPVIRVRLNKKADERTEDDLAFDMTGYRKKFPNIQFADIEVAHATYRCFPKLFFVEGDFYEYVTYVNPGEAYWYSFSVALSSQKKPAGEEALAAYRKVIASLLAISGASPAAAPQVSDLSKFEAAVKAADVNLKSKKGKRYDEDFGRHIAPSLAKTLMACTKDIPATTGVSPFVILVRVGPSGEAEDVIVRPETPVALCVKAQIPAAGYPKPPGPAWWAKVEVTVNLKGVHSGGPAEMGRARDDPGYSHRYSYWIQLVRDSSVSYRCSRRTTEGTEESLVTFMLKDVTPEHVRLECTRSELSGTGPASAAGLIQLEFREADDEFQGWDLFDVRLGYNVFHALRNPAAKVVEEIREDLSIMGLPLPTVKTSIRFGPSDSETTLTVWLSEDIPGRIAKYVRENRGALAVREEASVAEYRTIKADPSEIERLRASRKPARIDIPAWDYMTVRLGLVDDYNIAFREFTEARMRIRDSAAELIKTNPAGFKKGLAPSLEMLKELAAQLNQDVRSAEKEIGPAEFAKLRPITRVGTQYASLILKEAEIYAAIAGAIASRRIIMDYLNSLRVKSDNLREDIAKTLQEFQKELTGLKDVRISFIR